MKLGELIEGTGLDPVAEGLDTEVSELAYRSADVVPGTLFFCVSGFTADGHDFAPEAVAHGACALVCERPLALGVPEIVVENVRVAMAPIAARFFGDPTAELEMVGVTGTNGKTTTVFLVREILGPAGRTARHRAFDRRRQARGGRAHDSGGDRSPAQLPADGGRGRSSVRDGGLLAR